jgi:hypothetical protein
MFGVNVLGAMALGIGLMVTVPTTLIAAAHVLRHLQEHAREGERPVSDAAAPVAPTQPAA